MYPLLCRWFLRECLLVTQVVDRVRISTEGDIPKTERPFKEVYLHLDIGKLTLNIGLDQTESVRTRCLVL